MVKRGDIESVVSEYLLEGTEKETKHEWTLENAPGSNGVKLLKASIHSPQAMDGPPFIMENELHLEFTFNSEMGNSTRLDITFHLMDEMGNLVFVGSTARTAQENIVARGIFNATCIIPGDLMNEGTYYISRLLIIKNKGSVLYEHRDLLNFKIVRPSGEKLGWQGKKEGIVRPKLAWKIDIEEKKPV